MRLVRIPTGVWTRRPCSHHLLLFMSDFMIYKPCLYEVPHEEIEQAEFVKYLRLKNIKFTAIPNSTYTTSWKQKAKNKRMGLNPGLPDLLILLPGKLLFIEMKRIKNGSVSEYQKEWISALNQIQNVEAVVCRGCQEAIVAVDRILNNKI